MRNWFIILLLPFLIGAASIDYNGTTSSTNCGSGSSLDNLVTYTIALWIKIDGDPENDRGYLYAKDGGSSLGDIFQLIDTTQASCTNGGSSYCFNLNTDHATRGSWITDSDYTTSQYHLFLTYDGGSVNNNPTLLVDCSEVTLTENDTPVGAYADDSTESLFIGNRNDGARTFNGKISYYQIYNRVLNTSECRDTMHRPGSVVNGLVFYRPFWGTNETDLSGNGHSCTDSNVATSEDGPPVMLSGGGK